MTDLGTFLSYANDCGVILKLMNRDGDVIDEIETYPELFRNASSVGLESIKQENRFYNSTQLEELEFESFGIDNRHNLVVWIKLWDDDDIQVYSTEVEAELAKEIEDEDEDFEIFLTEPETEDEE